MPDKVNVRVLLVPLVEESFRDVFRPTTIGRLACFVNVLSC